MSNYWLALENLDEKPIEKAPCSVTFKSCNVAFTASSVTSTISCAYTITSAFPVTSAMSGFLFTSTV